MSSRPDRFGVRICRILATCVLTEPKQDEAVRGAVSLRHRPSIWRRRLRRRPTSSGSRSVELTPVIQLPCRDPEIRGHGVHRAVHMQRKFHGVAVLGFVVLLPGRCPESIPVYRVHWVLFRCPNRQTPCPALFGRVLRTWSWAKVPVSGRLSREGYSEISM